MIKYCALSIEDIRSLKEAALAAPNITSLHKVMVTATGEHTNYQHAALFDIAGRKPRLVALSGGHSYYLEDWSSRSSRQLYWLMYQIGWTSGPKFLGRLSLRQNLLAHFVQSPLPNTGTSILIDAGRLPETLTSIIALPLDRPDGTPMAVLWLCRVNAWTHDERQALDGLSGRSFLSRILGR
ncbi:MAG: hypothetical protein WCJ64_00525 [Rhodospirillaceae bacterium]